MGLFVFGPDRELIEKLNKELYQLYCDDIRVFKLMYKTNPSKDLVYHEDPKAYLQDAPTYTIPGYVNVADDGVAALQKGGLHVERQLRCYFSRKLLEDALVKAGLDKYKDVPEDEDVLYIQDGYYEIITVGIEGYHTNHQRFPFDYACLVKPWQRDSQPTEDRYIRR